MQYTCVCAHTNTAHTCIRYSAFDIAPHTHLRRLVASAMCINMPTTYNSLILVSCVCNLSMLLLFSCFKIYNFSSRFDVAACFFSLCSILFPFLSISGYGYTHTMIPFSVLFLRTSHWRCFAHSQRIIEDRWCVHRKFFTNSLLVPIQTYIERWKHTAYIAHRSHS